MIKTIKMILIGLVVLSIMVLLILFIQDRTRKLEDREYKEIEGITINSDKANINIYKSDNDKVKVVVYGSNKDTVKIVEGSKYLTVTKETGKNKCFLNCKNEINLYIPDNLYIITINSKLGNISFDNVLVNNINVKTDKGNVLIDKSNSIKVESDKGNVTINEINANNDSYIKTDIGNIAINKIINLKIEAKSETGSVVIPYIKEEQEHTLKIESNKGNVDIDSYENKSE